MTSDVVLLAASALAGSVPMSYVIVKLVKHEDIRMTGSGNAGATNAFRSLGWKGAVPVFIFDFLKGFVPVWIALRSGIEFSLPGTLLAVLAGLAAFAGHLFPVFIGGRGGKGVATGAGFFSALEPLLFPACLAVFIVAFLARRKVSLASIAASVSLPVFYAAIFAVRGTWPEWYLLVIAVLVPVVVIARHRKNIARLIDGTEKPLF
jgi:glycerol-3-phosphate acyltransferase PlsY